MLQTDRTIRTSEGLDLLDFAKQDGLLPVVVQDTATGTVLMLAWADREALEATLSSGLVHFRSRSRGVLWKKGETSGNTLTLVSLHTDCDADSLLARVRPSGPACHTGEQTCFGAETDLDIDTLTRLDQTIADRAKERPEGSYTVRLLDDGNLRLKKLGEETAELVAALATSDGERATEETADLLYHALVALRAEGIGADAVLKVLETRHGS